MNIYWNHAVRLRESLRNGTQFHPPSQHNSKGWLCCYVSPITNWDVSSGICAKKYHIGCQIEPKTIIDGCRALRGRRREEGLKASYAAAKLISLPLSLFVRLTIETMVELKRSEVPREIKDSGWCERSISLELEIWRFWNRSKETPAHMNLTREYLEFINEHEIIALTCGLQRIRCCMVGKS